MKGFLEPIDDKPRKFFLEPVEESQEDKLLRLSRIQGPTSGPVGFESREEAYGDLGPYQPPMPIQEMATKVRHTFQPVPAMGYGYLKKGMGGLAQAVGAKATGKQWAEEADLVRQQIETEHPLEPGGLGDTVRSAAANIYAQAPSLALGVFNPALGLASFGLPAAGESFHELEKAGFGAAVKYPVAITKGVAEVATEMIPFKTLFKKGMAPGKRALQLYVSELFGENINTTINAALDKVTLRPDMTMDDYINDLKQTTKQTLAQTTMMGAGAAGIHRIVSGPQKAILEPVAETEQPKLRTVTVDGKQYTEGMQGTWRSDEEGIQAVKSDLSRKAALREGFKEPEVAPVEIKPRSYKGELKEEFKGLEDEDIKYLANEMAQDLDRMGPIQREDAKAWKNFAETGKELSTKGDTKGQILSALDYPKNAETFRKKVRDYMEWKEHPRFAKGEGQAAKAESLDAVLQPTIKQWKNAPPIKVVQTTAELPAHLTKYIASTKGAGVVEGLFDPKSKSVYLVADNLTDTKRAQEVLFHETLGHYGLRGTMGDAIKPLLNEVYARHKTDADAIASQYGLDTKTWEGRQEAAEEVLSQMAQKGTNPTLIQKAVAAIRRWLKKMGLDIKLSNNDIKGIVADAAKFVEKGKVNEETSKIREDRKAGSVYSRARGQDTIQRKGKTKSRDTKKEAKSLVESRTRTEIQKKLQVIFGSYEHLEEMESGERDFTLEFDIADKYMADIERAAVDREYDTTEGLLKDAYRELDEEYSRQHQPSAFSRKPEELPKYAGSINLDRIEGMRGAKKLILDTSKEYKGKIDEARRGVITHEATRQMANDLGMTEKQLLKRRQGQALNAEEALAARDILNASAHNLKDLEFRVKSSDSNENLAAFRVALDKHAAIQAEVSGIATEAGRALSAHRIKSARDARMTKNYQGMIDALGGREMNEEILKYFAEVDKGNQFEVNKFVAEMSKATVPDMVFEAWVNFLLSGPPTQVVNITSNALTFLTKVGLEVPAAATIDMFRSMVTGTPKERFYGEMPHNIYGTWQGIKEGTRAGLQAFMTEIPSEAHSKLEYARLQAIPSKVIKRGQEKKKLKIRGKEFDIPLTGEVQIGGKQIRLPGRALMAFDEFFKAINHSAEIHAEAYRQAVKEGTKGKARAERIAELINNSTKEMEARAGDEMLYRVFQKDLGASGRHIQGWRTTTPGARYIVPFLRTPINIAKYGMERTPLNYAKIFNDAIKGKVKGGDISDNLARATVGSSIALLIVMLADEEKVTGGGPKGKTDRAALYRTGWQPYSFDIGGKYYSYGRLEPIGMVVGLTADATEIWDAMSADEEEQLTTLLTMGLMSISKNLTSKTFLRGLSDALNAATDPTRYGHRWVKSLAGTIVPTGAAVLARAQDPYLREAQTMIEGIKARIPGKSKELGYRYDIWGEAIKRGTKGAAALVSPIYVSEKKQDPVDLEIVRVGARIGQPSDKIKGIKLTNDQHDKMMKMIGKRAKPKMLSRIKNAGYKRLSDEKKAEKLEKWYKDVARSVKSQMYNQELRGQR